MLFYLWHVIVICTWDNYLRSLLVIFANDAHLSSRTSLTFFIYSFLCQARSMKYANPQLTHLRPKQINMKRVTGINYYANSGALTFCPGVAHMWGRYNLLWSFGEIGCDFCTSHALVIWSFGFSTPFWVNPLFGFSEFIKSRNDSNSSLHKWLKNYKHMTLLNNWHRSVTRCFSGLVCKYANI